MKFSYKIQRYQDENQIIDNLRKQLEEDVQLRSQLLYSIQNAEKEAQLKLDPILYEALDWPLSISEFLQYVQNYLSKIPKNSNKKCWLNQGYSKEVLDRICHFHLLVGQKFEKEENLEGYHYNQLQEHLWFKDWLKDFSDCLGQFLDTPESMTEENFKSFMESPEYKVQDSMIYDEKRGYYHPNSPSGWLTFNQFFARKLNAGLRPIQEPENNRIISSPADCTFKESFNIQEDGCIPEITMKHSHKFGTVFKLMDNSNFAVDFKDGIFIHYFLNTHDYHRFHSPVDGKVIESKIIQGQTKMDSQITENGQFDAPDEAKEGYEFYQTRGMVVVDTQYSQYGNIGKVAMIPVGMSQVSSVVLSTIKSGCIQKGEEFGYFQFGGSDMILLFQGDQNIKMFLENTHYNYGEQIGEIKIQNNNQDNNN